MARGLKFGLKVNEEEGLYNVAKTNALISCAADLHLCFHISNQRTNGPLNAHLTISQV